jgi:replicative DNA helicase Mcm
MLRQGKRIEKESVTSITPVIPKETLKKYISFARQNVFPALSKEAIQAISDYYLNLREQGRKEGAYTATHRQLEGLVRLAEASARVRLSDEVERQDAERAIALLRYSLQELVTDRETGRIDIDLITTGQTQSQQDNLRKVLNIVKSICRETDAAPKEQVFEEAEMMGIDIGKAENLVRQLVSKGELYEPKHGFLKPAQRD